MLDVLVLLFDEGEVFFCELLTTGIHLLFGWWKEIVILWDRFSDSFFDGFGLGCVLSSREWLQIGTNGDCPIGTPGTLST